MLYVVEVVRRSAGSCLLRMSLSSSLLYHRLLWSALLPINKTFLCFLPVLPACLQTSSFSVFPFSFLLNDNPSFIYILNCNFCQHLIKENNLVKLYLSQPISSSLLVWCFKHEEIIALFIPRHVWYNVLLLSLRHVSHDHFEDHYFNKGADSMIITCLFQWDHKCIYRLIYLIISNNDDQSIQFN